MRRRFTRKRMVLILTVALLLLALGGALLFAARAPADALTAARVRWTTTGYVDYRIVVALNSATFTCEMDFEVRGGTVSEMHSSTCPGIGGGQRMAERYTIGALFERIQTHVDARLPCGTNGCQCDGILGLEVAYDSALGYPVRLDQPPRPELRFFTFDYWGALLRGILTCPAQASDSTQIEVRSLTPLKPLKPESGGIETLPRP